jgi:hypothetical protein
MWHRGIEYEVTRTGTTEPWAWVVHTPEARRGQSRSQILAMLRAKRVINTWCKQHPQSCGRAANDRSRTNQPSETSFEIS